jgi:serine/threonine protein kinase
MTMHPDFLKRTESPSYVAICSISPDSHPLLKLYDVIKGLIYLHGLGVVHTDLKGVCPALATD